VTEDVEIGGVEVFGDVETISALAEAMPAIFDARDASVIEVDGTFGGSLSLQDLRVIYSHSDEEQNGSREPDGGEAMRSKIDPEESYLRENQQEAKIAEADVNSLEMLDLELASLLTVQVLLRWRSELRHRVIITRRFLYLRDV
jgi:hypothetical protein